MCDLLVDVFPLLGLLFVLLLLLALQVAHVLLHLLVHQLSVLFEVEPDIAVGAFFGRLVLLNPSHVVDTTF